MTSATALQKFVDELAAISGPEHVQVEDGVVSVIPATTQEIAAALRRANQSGISVSPYGGGTKQSWGNPVRPTLILHTKRLAAVLEHTWQDMTCTVEAGCAWSSMQLSLAKHGQFVALDPLWPDRATVGGVGATNDSGTLRLRYGSLRDLVIGMTVVLADGVIARSGGKVVKNVAGYDLHKLMTGAFGTLGLITEITFRLHSIPQHVQSFTISSPGGEPLGRLLMDILNSHLSAQSVQLRSCSDGHNLDVRLATLPEVIRDQAFSLAKLAEKVHLSISDASPAVWTSRENHFEQTDSFVIKATMLPSDITRIAARVHALGGSSTTQATGIMIASIPIAASAQLLDLRKQLEAIHGSLTILHNPLDGRAPESSTPVDTLSLMHELKRRFDPNRILNPGRFVGGI
jgi:glycolate oxidase FAD binding subunit